MSVPEDQLQNTLADATAAPVTLSISLESIGKMTKDDLLKLKSDVDSGVSVIEAALVAYAKQEEEKIKQEAEAKWKAFFASTSFSAIHLSISTLALIGVAVMLLVK